MAACTTATTGRPRQRGCVSAVPRSFPVVPVQPSMNLGALEVRRASAPALDQRLTPRLRPVWGQLRRSVRRNSPLARCIAPPALRARQLGGIWCLFWCACLVSASQSPGRNFCGVLRRPGPFFRATATACPAAAMCASALSPSLCPCTAWCSRTLTACGPSAHIWQAPSCASRCICWIRRSPAASAWATLSERSWSALPCVRVGGWRGGGGIGVFEAGLALRSPPSVRRSARTPCVGTTMSVPVRVLHRSCDAPASHAFRACRCSSAGTAAAGQRGPRPRLPRTHSQRVALMAAPPTRLGASLRAACESCPALSGVSGRLRIPSPTASRCDWLREG